MKSLINTALLKEQLKRFWPVAAFPMLFYILFIVIPIYQSNMDDRNKISYLIATISMQNPVLIISSILTPLVAVFSGFSYLFQPKTTAAVHSWPLNKKQLWFTNVLSGLILTIAPVFILSLLLLNPVRWVMPESVIINGFTTYQGMHVYVPYEIFSGGFAEGAVVNTLSIVISFFLRACLVFIFYYGIFLAAAFTAGNGVVYFALGAVIPLIPTGLCLIYKAAAIYYCFGYPPDGELIVEVFIRTNAAALPFVFTMFAPVFESLPDKMTNLFPYVSLYMLIAAMFYGLSYWCSSIRSQERASDSVVFNPVKYVLIFLVSVGGMVLMGGFFLQMFNSVALMYIGFAVGFIIAYIIAQMIAEKTINVLYKGKSLIKYGLVVMGFFALIAGLTTFDLAGYEKYVPELSEIEGVYLQNNFYYVEKPVNAPFESDIFIKDSVVINDVYNAHLKITSNRKSLRAAFLRNVSGNTEPDERIRGQHIIYRLTNGKIISRHYALPFSFMEDSGLNQVLISEKVVLSTYYTFDYPELISELRLYHYDPETEKSSDIVIEDTEQIKEGLEAIKKDLVETAKYNYEFERENTGQDILVEKTVRSSISGSVQLPQDKISQYRQYDHFNLEVSDNTAKWLIEEGLLEETALSAE